jgi:mannose-6-phosphate isomerase-like protein (cupin superfamily)
MTKPYHHSWPVTRVIDNPVLKDRVTFIKTGQETYGEYLLLKLELAPHGGNLMHYHRTFTETFTVVDGQLHLVVAGKQQLLKAGQTACMPRQVHHRFFNPSQSQVTATVEIRPARRFEQALRVSYGLARDGKTNAQAVPTNLWHLALLFQLADTYVPGPPWFVQQGLLGLVAHVAKRLGKDQELKKYQVTGPLNQGPVKSQLR